METFYFAYGSNMNPERMNVREAYFTRRTAAKLHDFKLVFNFVKIGNPGEAAANIVPDDGNCVEGTLYLMDEDGIAKLDVFEGFPDHYRRKPVSVITDDGEMVDALAYIANDDKTADGLKPSREYLSHLLAGKDLLSHEYFRKLEATETID